MATKKSSENNSTNSITMEELLASQTQRITNLHRGQEVEGEVVSTSDKEIILDLGAKSEGIIQTRLLSDAVKSQLKLGSKLKAFVVTSENEYGQTVLSLVKQTTARFEGTKGHFRAGKGRGGRFADWSRFVLAQNQKTKLSAKVIEVNKGGLMVEVTGIRGFLPNSQIGFELMSKAGQALNQNGSGYSMENLIGESLTVTVIEVDINNNKLIFSQRGSVSAKVKAKLESFQPGQQVTGKIVAVLPFGLMVDAGGVEGLVFISDVSWDRVEDLSKSFQSGQELAVKVLGQDLELGRLNLSIKQLTEDPFVKLTEKFTVDEVVKGEVVSMSEAGVAVKLAQGVAGFLAAEKMMPGTDYEAGTQLTFLVDSVDMHRRRVNLAPFVTSTAGLIYK